MAARHAVASPISAIGGRCIRRGGGDAIYDDPTSEFGAEHPVYRVIQSILLPDRRPYAWYMRVPELADFLRHITPALDARVADSILVGHTGELALNFYRTGLRLTFAAGHLAEIAPWEPTSDERGDAAFPDLTFLQLLFGYRALDELTQFFPDCIARNDGARVLLDTLFPKQSSNVWPIA